MADPVVWHLAEAVTTGLVDLSNYDGSWQALTNIKWRLATQRRILDRQKQLGYLIQASTVQGSDSADFMSAQQQATQAASVYASLLDPGAAASSVDDPIRTLALLYLMHARDKLGIDEPGQPTPSGAGEQGKASGARTGEDTSR